jgi:hypothetical protein
MVNWEQKVLIKLNETNKIPAEAINILNGNYDLEYYDTLSKMVESYKFDNNDIQSVDKNANASFNKIKITGLKFPKLKNRPTSKKSLKKTIKKNRNCPYIYSVQIASSKEKLSLKKF